jgi:hypothetical protein
VERSRGGSGCGASLRGEDGEVGVFEGRLELASLGGRYAVSNDAGMDAITAMSGAADEMFLTKRGKFCAGDHDLPNFARDLRE